jgi:hypothetical protein
MRRLSMIGLCVVATLALSAMASAAQAAEYGVCVPAAHTGHTYTGKFIDKACVAPAGPREIERGRQNRYEWYPGLTGIGQDGQGGVEITRNNFVGVTKAKAPVLVVREGGSIECRASTGMYEVTGVKTGVEQTTFTGCLLSTTRDECTSAGSSPGVIATGELQTRLFAPGEPRPESRQPAEGEVWLEQEDREAPGALWVEFTCGAPEFSFTMRGWLSGSLSRDIDVMSSTGETAFAEMWAEQDLFSSFFNTLTERREEGLAELLEHVIRKSRGQLEIRR